jgi:hypothetical protein
MLLSCETNALALLLARRVGCLLCSAALEFSYQAGPVHPQNAHPQPAGLPPLVAGTIVPLVNRKILYMVYAPVQPSVQ